MRKLNALALASIAILAISGVEGSAASAQLTSEAYPTVLTGSVEPGFTDEFLTTVGAVKCTTPKYTATVGGPTSSLTASASYGGCTTAGIPSKFEMNGCTYKFNFAGGALTGGDLDIVCPAGKELTVTVTPESGTSPCTIHVKAQSDIGGTVTYTNIGAGSTREITAHAKLWDIDYTHTAGTGLAKCTPGSAVNGIWELKAVFTGEVDPSGSHRGVFLSSEWG